jgi:protein-disulfide isomerase
MAVSESEAEINSETGPNSETEPDAQPAPASADSASPSWQRWLIPATAGVVGVGVGAVITFFVAKGIGPTEEATPLVSGEADAVEPVDEEAARAEEFRQRQQYVSDVVNQLGRDVLIGDSPTRGNPDASVVLIKFSDFQCPFCAEAAAEAERFVDGHGAEVLFVYKHLPLAQIHPEAVPAALAAWAAQQQGEFWAFQSALFNNQDRLGDDLYGEIAGELGLDMAQFDRDRASEAAQAAIARDLALAAELRLNSTPTFLMNDLLIPGVVPADFFAEALDRIQAFQQQQQP